jgi:WD40 repeat protein
VTFWDATTGKANKVLKGHTDAVWAVAVAPDGKTAASGGLDNTIILPTRRMADG